MVSGVGAASMGGACTGFGRGMLGYVVVGLAGGSDHR